MRIFARSENPSLRNRPSEDATPPWGQKSASSCVLLIFSDFAQAALQGTLSTLRPAATVPAFSKPFRFFSSDCICFAQIDVHARGWKDRRTFFPLKAESLNACPF